MIYFCEAVRFKLSHRLCNAVAEIENYYFAFWLVNANIKISLYCPVNHACMILCIINNLHDVGAKSASCSFCEFPIASAQASIYVICKPFRCIGLFSFIVGILWLDVSNVMSAVSLEHMNGLGIFLMEIVFFEPKLLYYSHRSNKALLSYVLWIRASPAKFNVIELGLRSDFIY